MTDVLDLVTDLFVEDGVGQEDEPVRAGVGVGVLAGLSGRNTLDFCASIVALFPVGRAPGCLRHLRGHSFIRRPHYTVLFLFCL